MTITATQKLFSLTQEEQDLLPSEKDVQLYESKGYYISPKIIPDEFLDSVLEASEHYYSGQIDEGPPIPPECLPTGGPYEGLRKHDYASLRCSGIHRLVHFPLVAATAARLARVNEIRLWRDELLYKPPGAAKGARVGWHRDRVYWPHCTSDKLLTAWIPFTSVSEEMGPMQVSPGSNHWQSEGESARRFSDQDLEQHEARLAARGHSINPVPLVLDRGQVSFHGCFTYHASSDNVSHRPRRSLVVHMQDGDNRYRALEGGKMGKWNNGLVRRDSQGQPDYTDPVYCPTLWRE